MLTLFAAILSGRQTTYTPRKARISNQHKISYTFNVWTSETLRVRPGGPSSVPVSA
jgi:hypothetical protein